MTEEGREGEGRRKGMGSLNRLMVELLYEDWSLSLEDIVEKNFSQNSSDSRQVVFLFVCD